MLVVLLAMAFAFGALVTFVIMAGALYIVHHESLDEQRRLAGWCLEAFDGANALAAKYAEPEPFGGERYRKVQRMAGVDAEPHRD